MKRYAIHRVRDVLIPSLTWTSWLWGVLYTHVERQDSNEHIVGLKERLSGSPESHIWVLKVTPWRLMHVLSYQFLPLIPEIKFGMSKLPRGVSAKQPASWCVSNWHPSNCCFALHEPRQPLWNHQTQIRGHDHPGSLLSAWLSQCNPAKESEITENVCSEYRSSRWYSHAGALCCHVIHTPTVWHRAGEASHFLLFLELPCFFHLRCQCLLTGFTREEKSHCSGDARKRSKPFFAFFLATGPMTSSTFFLGGEARMCFCFLSRTSHTTPGH